MHNYIALLSRLRSECSATSEGLFLKLSGNLRTRPPSICEGLAASRILALFLETVKQLSPNSSRPNSYRIIFRPLKLRTFNRIAKIAGRNHATLSSPLTTSWVFGAWGHTKGGAAMLDVSSTTAITLHLCILSTSYKGNPCMHNKRNHFLHKWPPSATGLTGVLEVSSGARVHGFY